MKYDYKVTQDGHTYEPGTNVPDMGSVICIKSEGNKRDYVFLAEDTDKLPTYDDLLSGSSALCVDEGIVYVYERTIKKWYQQGA